LGIKVPPDKSCAQKKVRVLPESNTTGRILTARAIYHGRQRKRITLNSFTR
jgi:hypothetical protein